jgi:hypothetical protein
MDNETHPRETGLILNMAIRNLTLNMEMSYLTRDTAREFTR